MAGEDGVHVHLFEIDATVGNYALRNDLQIANLICRLFAAVGLDQADDNIFALLALHQGVIEHVVGFADAGGCANIDAQPGGFLLAFETGSLPWPSPPQPDAGTHPATATGSVKRNVVP